MGANVGDGTGLGVGVGTPGTLSTLGTPGTTATPGTLGAKPTAAVAQLSGNQLARMKKRCVDVLSNEGSYDSDLRALCLMVARR